MAVMQQSSLSSPAALWLLLLVLSLACCCRPSLALEVRTHSAEGKVGITSSNAEQKVNATSTGRRGEPRFRHRLRICNTYPSKAAFAVTLSKTKISKAPLEYKSCEEYEPPVKTGDRLEFHVGTTMAGSFVISDLPQHDAMLVLVLYRQSPSSTAVAFESHIFANLVNAQIAVIDAYKGRQQAELRIQDGSTAKTSRSEALQFDNVVAVNPGFYEVVAEDLSGNMLARQELVALNRESYLVLRVGMELVGTENEEFPQELLVFPRSDPKVLLEGAAWSVKIP
eukprot:CAMPEP_0206470954 /NCGR_PEP_ID=MMETSP0324_2-20121206/31259_1 /ASSEMBLY_ACC=CAM_ASM_000836 /TAXON_ID=2866 /ORGANISM="Crypthecodinium cohnii, Strain Seligo" /LENGTH=281 /DNA_ID=CAMNT_0053945155 /DNA_START=67 /DNA_END=909 /DNA_ORIENTATION=+